MKNLAKLTVLLVWCSLSQSPSKAADDGTARQRRGLAGASGGVVLSVPESLFEGMPKVLKTIGVKPFLKFMKDSTGIEGTVTFEQDVSSLARKMMNGKIQVAVFQGHEFAWVREECSGLVPIAVASPTQPVQAFCLVRWDCAAKSVAELTGSIALPPVHRDYCDIFLKKQLAGKAFEKRKADSAADAIFDVIEGKCAGTVVDFAALKFFERNYPGPFKNMKVLCQSEVFPNACIAVKNGGLDEASIARLREALLGARKLPGGAALLATWKLDGFVSVSDSYERELANIKKAYPKPQ